MGISRRAFVTNSTLAGTGFAIIGAVRPLPLWAQPSDDPMAPYLTGSRMAATPASSFRAYSSKAVSAQDVTTWVQIDLGKHLPIASVQLFPASGRMYPGRDAYYGGEAFPLRFRLDASNDPAFRQAEMVADFTQSDFPDLRDNITQYAARNLRARYVRLTATKLRPSA